MNCADKPKRRRRQRIVVGCLVIGAGVLGSLAVGAAWSRKELDPALTVEVVQHDHIEEAVTAMRCQAGAVTLRNWQLVHFRKLRRLHALA